MTGATQMLVALALVSSAAVPALADEQLTLDKKVLSLAAARVIVATAEAEARSRGLGVVIVVVDDAGNIIQVTRMDTAQVASVQVGIGKARTAAIYRRPSRDFEEQIRNGPLPRWPWPMRRRSKAVSPSSSTDRSSARLASAETRRRSTRQSRSLAQTPSAESDRLGARGRSIPEKP